MSAELISEITDRVIGEFNEWQNRPLELVWPVIEIDAIRIRTLSDHENGIPHGPGRRFMIAGQTVAGFHLFVAEDPADPRPGALVVFGIDVWLNDFPD